MKRLLLIPLFASLALAQPGMKPFAGRWDFTVTSGSSTWPQWMELVDKDGGAQVRIQPRGGAVRPAESVKIEGDRLLITVANANGTRPAVMWELSSTGADKLTGVQKTGDKETAQLAGVRAPLLKRKEPKSWTRPEPLFNGKDLTGWEPIGDPANSHWVAKDGDLMNEAKGANLKTTRKFEDFKLHIEVNCPEHCNSGIYLRGRDEIQVGTEGGKNPSHEMGALYGFAAPSIEVPLKFDQWDTFDITLVGRVVTVVFNGKTIHDHLEIPGITGGALDSNEGEPGPFFLQGDHTGGLRYRNITISLPKK